MTNWTTSTATAVIALFRAIQDFFGPIPVTEPKVPLYAVDDLELNVRADTIVGRMSQQNVDLEQVYDTIFAERPVEEPLAQAA